jgi:amino acid transporter
MPSFFTALVTLAFALSGSFTTLAVASALERLVIYLAVSAATLRLRRPALDESVRPATFPFGPTVPVLAIVISVLMLAGANRPQFLGGTVALAIGTAVYLKNCFALLRQNSKTKVNWT